MVFISLEMVSCSSDDSDNGGYSMEKHITKIDYTTNDPNRQQNQIIYTINYDSEGRISSAHKNTMTPNRYTYKYYVDKIEEELFGINTYYLLNNRIVSDTNYMGSETNYDYDNNNHIKAISSMGVTRNFIWSSGNIIQEKRDTNSESLIFDIEYTNYVCPKNYPMYIFGFSPYGGFSPNSLMFSKYLGVQLRNLPKRYGDYEYNYTMEDNYPVKVEITNKDKTRSYSYIITWN
jgi:hypothetical protein